MNKSINDLYLICELGYSISWNGTRMGFYFRPTKEYVDSVAIYVTPGKEHSWSCPEYEAILNKKLMRLLL